LLLEKADGDLIVDILRAPPKKLNCNSNIPFTKGILFQTSALLTKADDASSLIFALHFIDSNVLITGGDANLRELPNYYELKSRRISRPVD